MKNASKDFSQLNKVEIVTLVRPNGSVRIQQDFSKCPSMAEQHTADSTDINVLMERYQPDELAAYIAARNSHRSEIIGHDFSTEPDLQEAQNVVYRIRQNFEALPEEIRRNFKNHVEFMKFIDNPDNQEKMVKMGLLTKKEISQLTTDATTPTQETKEAKE